MSPAAPPGYRLSTPAPDLRVVRPPLYFTLLVVSALIASANEVLFRQPTAYLSPGFGPSQSWVLLLSLASLIASGFAASRLRKPSLYQLGVWLLVSGVATALSAVAWFFGFGFAKLFPVVAVLVPATVSALLGRTAVLAFRCLARLSLELRFLESLLHPFRLLALSLALGLGASALPLVGLLRSAALVGLILSALSAWCIPLFAYLERRDLEQARPLAFGSRSSMMALFVWFAASDGLVGIDDVRLSANAVVYSYESERSRFVFTSGQDSFELFIDGRLKVAGLDDQRYYEALVHPVMAAASRQSNVLVLGSGEGLIERELLLYDAVKHITSVTRDRTLGDMSQRVAWLSARSEAALSSPRVTLLEQEPLVFLRSEGARYDVIIVDLMDPEGHLQGKNYTTYFYEQLRKRLRDGGAAVIQATSPFASPRTFASIRATVEAAGLTILPYHAPIPTLGDWGFLIASTTKLSPPRQLRADLQFLSTNAVSQLFIWPTDAEQILNLRVPPSTLYNQRVVDVFNQEAAPNNL